MILILICAALLVLGIGYLTFVQYGKLDIPAIAACVFGGIGLMMCAMSIPLERMKWHSAIQEIEAIRESRATEDPIEGAAWRMKVAEVNARIAKGRYYNGTLFDIWIPDEIEKVEPIK